MSNSKSTVPYVLKDYAGKHDSENENEICDYAPPRSRVSIKSTPSKVSPLPQSTGQRSAASRSVGQKSAKTNREDKPKGPNRERSIDLQRKQAQKRNERSYAEWHKVKAEVKQEDQQMLLDKVALQQELIKSHDQLYQLNQEQAEQKKKQKLETQQTLLKQQQQELVKIGKESIDEDRKKLKEKRKEGKEKTKEESKRGDPDAKVRQVVGPHGGPYKGPLGGLQGRIPTDLSSHSSLASAPFARTAPQGRLADTVEEGESDAGSDGSEEEYYTGASPEGYHRVYRRASLVSNNLPEYHRHLYGMFGPQADYFLYPKMEETEKKRTAVIIDPKIRQYGAQVGAKQLWKMLRNESQMKLIHEDSRISPELKSAYGAFVRQCLTRRQKPVKRNYYVQEDVPDMAILLDQSSIYKAQNATHQLELMFRASHMNADRACVLMHNNPPPDLNDLEGEESCVRYIPSWSDDLSLTTEASYKKWLQHQASQTDDFDDDQQSSVPDQLQDEGSVGSHERSRDSAAMDDRGVVQSPLEYKPLRRSTDGVKLPKLNFLTEKASRCPGEFTQRFDRTRQQLARAHQYVPPEDEEPQQELNQGPTKESGSSVTQSAMGHLESVAGSKLSVDQTDFSSHRSQTDINPTSNVKVKQGRVWAPLSLSAVGEYSSQLPSMGVGRFNQGRTPVWTVGPQVSTR